MKEQGISTALDTCGLTSPGTFDRLLPYTDLILFDLKLLDPGLHRKFTKVTNQQILENLAHIRKTIQQHPQRIELWIRTPLIPGATDTDENLSAIGHYLAEQMEGTVARWELCAFNNLCRDQYTRLGLEWEYADTPLMSRADMVHANRLPKPLLFTRSLCWLPAQHARKDHYRSDPCKHHYLTTFSETDIQNTQPAMKVGLLATVNPEGMPHVTLISSLMACGPAQLCFGQFTEGNVETTYPHPSKSWFSHHGPGQKTLAG